MEFESAFAKRMLKSAAHRFASQPSVTTIHRTRRFKSALAEQGAARCRGLGVAFRDVPSPHQH